MTDRQLMKVGVVGALLTAILAFTPKLTVVLEALGAGPEPDWLDYVLYPLLGVFIGLIIVTVLRQQEREND